MSAIAKLLAPNAFAARLFTPLHSLFALGARLYVSSVFLKSGYIKVTNWQSTMYLFENEYQVPVLSPHVAAVAGSFGELFFPTLLVLGLASRLGAIGLSFVNAMAVYIPAGAAGAGLRGSARRITCCGAPWGCS